MKTEMKMMDNGNYEKVVSFIQHECFDKNSIWHCVEYSSEPGKIWLKIEDGDICEDGYKNEVEVKYCPFCGYVSSEVLCPLTKIKLML